MKWSKLTLRNKRELSENILGFLLGVLVGTNSSQRLRSRRRDGHQRVKDSEGKNQEIEDFFMPNSRASSGEVFWLIIGRIWEVMISHLRSVVRLTRGANYHIEHGAPVIVILTWNDGIGVGWGGDTERE